MADPAYEEAVQRIEQLLTLLLPRYAEGGKSYITVAFGCTGGRHRSVHVAERIARDLQDAGFSPTVRSEEHTSELQSLMRISYAVFCLKKKTINYNYNIKTHTQNPQTR